MTNDNFRLTGTAPHNTEALMQIRSDHGDGMTDCHPTEWCRESLSIIISWTDRPGGLTWAFLEMFLVTLALWSQELMPLVRLMQKKDKLLLERIWIWRRVVPRRIRSMSGRKHRPGARNVPESRYVVQVDVLCRRSLHDIVRFDDGVSPYGSVKMAYCSSISQGLKSRP